MREPLIQWKYRRSPWRLLVACVCLNRTRGTVAKPIIEEIFRRWPAPASLSWADRDELVGVIRPLGLHTNRSRHLIQLSEAYNPTPMPREVVEALPGCGPYAADCYQLLVVGDLTVAPEDKELARWREWAIDNPPRWVTRRPRRPWGHSFDPMEMLSWAPEPVVDVRPAERRIRLEGGPLHGQTQTMPANASDRLSFPHMESAGNWMSEHFGSPMPSPSYTTIVYQRTGVEYGRDGTVEIYTPA